MFKAFFANLRTKAMAFEAKTQAVKTALIGSAFLAVSENALAFTKAKSLVDQFLSFLTGIGVAVITIAVIIAGYKILFQGQTFREVAPILIGGILIGSAATIAGVFAP